MYRERGGGGSKGKMERSSTATSSRGGAGGLNLNGKETNKDRSTPVNSKISSLSRSSYPNKKLSKGYFSSSSSRPICLYVYLDLYPVRASKDNNLV